MNTKKAEKLFELMKRHGVEHFKTLELEIRMGSGSLHVGPTKEPIKDAVKSSRKMPSPASVPPVTQSIPHHENEVSKLLKLSDNDLVDALFPEGPVANG